MTTQVITANRLQDGRVVYLTSADQWSLSIAEARLCEDEATEQAATATGVAAVTARKIVDPYLIPVAPGENGVTPTRYREVIRAFGPSIPTGIEQET